MNEGFYMAAGVLGRIGVEDLGDAADPIGPQVIGRRFKQDPGGACTGPRIASGDPAVVGVVGGEAAPSVRGEKRACAWGHDRALLFRVERARRE